MNRSQEKGWKLLTEEERLALTLSLSMGKSTWQAGEIMGKAHYKYLEIRHRAEYLVKRFTEYFSIYDTIIQDDCICSEEFQEFIRLAIGKRMPIKDIIAKMDNDQMNKPSLRNSLIIRDIERLKKSDGTNDQNLFNLIMDFDRWNNHRILPLEIQEPSAYKRRNKHKNRKLVRLTCNLNPLAIDKIMQVYGVKRRNSQESYLFVPIIKGTEVIQLIVRESNVKNITNLILFAFKDKKESERFGEIIMEYISKDFKHCKDGQLFWPEYRTITKSAINYEQLQNITPSRRYLESAFRDLDNGIVRNIRKSRTK